MRILILTKRQCVGRDILDDRYWRLFEIPEYLTELGHSVEGLALSYRPRGEGEHQFDRPTLAQWQSFNAGPLVPYKLWRYWHHLRNAIERFKPDVVWASSDALHAVAAWRACAPRNIPYVVDLYDNYESFGMTRFPGLLPLFRVACRQASGLTLISETLNEFIGEHYRLRPNTLGLVLGNAVDDSKFRPLSKKAARAQLGLPQDIELIGTAGAIQANRGIETLIEAFSLLAPSFPRLGLILAGPKDETIDRYDLPGLTYLGTLHPDKVPLFWNALDLAIVPNKDSDFGRYCYPQKLQEIVACGVPLVASRVGEVAELLRDTPASLADPDSPAALAERIDAQIREKIRVDRSQVRSWAQRAEELSEFFRTVLARSGEGSQCVGDGSAGRGGA